ncbi:hypothetical protein EDB19DRAFT_783689 [Suillus lakei]|nr:hypothetical protein EDB19DRAFT_783689 [Suillus lakei]
MLFSTLAYVTLAAAAALQPITSGNIGENARSSNKSIIKEGWGAVKSLFDGPSKITDAIYEEFDSLSASVHTWYDGLQFPDAFRDKIIELGPNIQEYTDELFHHAMALYPSEKIMEFRESVDSIAVTATAIHKTCSEAAEESGISLDSIAEELGDIFVFLFEELKEQFPPPHEAPGHENRTIMINTVLDRIEESFLPVAMKLGVSEELLTSHSSSLKIGVEHVIVTIGDLYEQHPELAIFLLSAVLAELSPLLLPEMGILLEGWLLRPILRMFGFGPQGPIKGGIAAWLQRWIFGSVIPEGSWFAVLQRLAMIGKKL